MYTSPKPYTTNIEAKIIEIMLTAKKSITIAMAWLTNKNIISTLLEIAETNRLIDIRIVVDDNSINKKYFEPYQQILIQSGINIFPKIISSFLHHKFLVIDKFITITGSYNLSKKANRNLENIVVTESKSLGNYFERIFKFLTTKAVDENINLLINYPDFAQRILSTYYNFNAQEIRKYRLKIIIGHCFTYPNGLYNEISYSPGIIFNKKYTYFKDLEEQEFLLPINKKIIQNWTHRRNDDLILERFRDYPNSYHLINGELQRSEKEITSFYKRKFEKIYTYNEFETFIRLGVDIIIEDEIWQNNFEPFLTKENIKSIFSIIKPNSY